jgi:GTPase SAR1 family protein
MAKNYYQRAHGIILTFALDKRSSFNNLKNWLNAIRDNTTQEIPLIIMANKKDLVDTREVPEEEIIEKAKELNVLYFESSAKENIMIDEAFDKIIKMVYDSVYVSKTKGFDLDEKKRNSKMENDSSCAC